MSKSAKKVVVIRQRRIFSEEFKRQKVQLIVEKKITIRDVSELYNVSSMSVYRWLYKYSPHHEKGSNQVVQMESEANKTKQALQQVADLERAIGQKQIYIDYLERLIQIGSEELGVDLKKSFNEPASNGSDKAKTNTPTP